MAGPKPKRADLVKSICDTTRIEYKAGSINFSNKQLKDLTLWVMQARKILSDFTASGKVESGDVTV